MAVNRQGLVIKCQGINKKYSLRKNLGGLLFCSKERWLSRDTQVSTY